MDLGAQPLKRAISSVLISTALVFMASACHADPKSNALFVRARRVARKIHSLEGHLEKTSSTSGAATRKWHGTLQVLKPRCWRARVVSADGKSVLHELSDGVSFVDITERTKQYLRQEPPSEVIGFPNVTSPVLTLLLAPHRLPGEAATHYLGRLRARGQWYQVVSAWDVEGWPPDIQVRLFFDGRGLPVGEELSGRGSGALTIDRNWLTDIRLNVPLAEREFAFTPPADYTLEEIPDFTDRLLRVGTEAPEFRLPRLDGGEPLTLSAARKGGKAVLVVFWTYLFDDGRAELVYLEKVYPRLRGQGLEIIAANPNEPRDQIRRYVKKRHFSFPQAVLPPDSPEVSQAYGLRAFPVTYLIDGPTGKVLWSCMGFDEKSLRAALKGGGLE